MRSCSRYRACLLALAVVGAVCHAEASRGLLQSGCQAGKGGKDCQPCGPGTFSKGGNYSACLSCDLAINAFCLSMPGPCDTKPACDPKTGKYAGMCWVAKPAGSTCDVPGAAAGSHVCQGRECVAKNSTAPAKAPSNTSQPGPQVLQSGCQAGKGGKDCQPCGPGTFSKGGNYSACLSCDLAMNAFCLSMPGPCDTKPACDPKTGKYAGMCWVAKPAGSICDIPGAAAGSHVCQGRECVAKNSTAPAKAPTPPSSTSQPGPQVQPAKCPDTPMCRMAAGPCDMAPPCDASGRPTAMCWVAKPEGAACTVPGSSTAGKCSKDRQCVAATASKPSQPGPQVQPTGPMQNRPQVLPLGPMQNRPQVLPVGPMTQPGPQVQPAKCPDTPMCRMAAGPCDMAPPCDASGRPTAMCWVAKPEGAACTVPGSSTAGKCSKERQCVA